MMQAALLEISQRDLSWLACDFSHAMPDRVISEPEAPLYRLLKAIQPSTLKSEAEWTRKARVSTSFFQDVKKGRRPRSDNLEKVIEAAGMTPAQFYALESPVRTEVAGVGLVGSEDVRRERFGEVPLPPLPVYGSAMGGEYGDLEEHIELTELHLNEVLDYLSRPASLANDPTAYILTVVGDSMSPRFEPGDRVAVSPRQPVAIGDDVIVQLRGTGGDGDDRVTMVLIKRLVRRTAAYIELRQFNPDVTFQIETRRVAAMHKVPGALF
jgi:phage repressor protein C with HTH and peptisase S24 domain